MSFHTTMREWHRYLGFFLTGIMAVYALSGMVLIFRDTDFLKEEINETKKVNADAKAEELAELLGFKQLKITEENEQYIKFENGVYDKQTGQAEFTLKKLPFLLEKMTRFHKAKSSEPLHYFNLFFGISLLFFVISSFWMFLPDTSIFRKGLWFTGGGLALAILLIFV